MSDNYKYKITNRVYVYSKKQGCVEKNITVANDISTFQEAIDYINKNFSNVTSKFVKEGNKWTATTSGMLYPGSITISAIKIK